MNTFSKEQWDAIERPALPAGVKQISVEETLSDITRLLPQPKQRKKPTSSPPAPRRLHRRGLRSKLLDRHRPRRNLRTALAPPLPAVWKKPYLGEMTPEQIENLWAAAAHESLLCRLAYDRFEAVRIEQRTAAERGRRPTRNSNIEAYNAYAYFIQLLHSTYMALLNVEQANGRFPRVPPEEKTEDYRNRFLLVETDRLLKGASGDAQRTGLDPARFNVRVPTDFPEDFTEARNTAGHADTRRLAPNKRLKDFFKEYHDPFVKVLYDRIASGYLDAHAREANWEAIDGFTTLLTEQKDTFGLVGIIESLNGYLEFNTDSISLGKIDEDEVDCLPDRFFGHIIPVLGVVPFDANDAWSRGFMQATREVVPDGSLASNLGVLTLLQGPQIPASVMSQTGIGLAPIHYAIRFEPTATPEKILEHRSAIIRCIGEAGVYWKEMYIRGFLNDNVPEHQRRIQLRDAVRAANSKI